MIRALLTGAALALAAGCTAIAPVEPVPIPPARPANLVPPASPAPSAESLQLARFYGRMERDLLARGLMRQDGGGPDTPFDADDLARNFETIAFFDEYASGGGLIAAGRGQSGRLRRWEDPVRLTVDFGPGVPEAQQAEDRAAVADYARRLARVTGHPVSVTPQGGDFLVLFMGQDDRTEAVERLRAHVPSVSAETQQVFRDLPRSIHCLVVAFSGGARPQTYTRAVALIRAEHPDLMRLSCIHEEIAQGLGLANDSPSARPSIFNDDDEFALLTTQDELLLKMLYDPRLRPGMTAEQARPVARIIARELMGQTL